MRAKDMVFDQLILKRINRGYKVTFVGPNAQDIEQLFGTTGIPLPIGSSLVLKKNQIRIEGLKGNGFSVGMNVR